MKHNTHIYLAAKAIEFLRDSVDNLKTLDGDNAASKSRTKTKLRAVDLQRLLRYHLRNDPPSAGDDTKPLPATRYYSESLHGRIEYLWDQARTPAAVAEHIFVADTLEDYEKKTDLSRLRRSGQMPEASVQPEKAYNLN